MPSLTIGASGSVTGAKLAASMSYDLPTKLPRVSVAECVERLRVEVRKEVQLVRQLVVSV